MTTVENEKLFFCVSMERKRQVVAGGGYRVTGAYYLFFSFFFNESGLGKVKC